MIDYTSKGAEATAELLKQAAVATPTSPYEDSDIDAMIDQLLNFWRLQSKTIDYEKRRAQDALERCASNSRGLRQAISDVKELQKENESWQKAANTAAEKANECGEENAKLTERLDELQRQLDKATYVIGTLALEVAP